MGLARTSRALDRCAGYLLRSRKDEAAEATGPRMLEMMLQKVLELGDVNLSTSACARAGTCLSGAEITSTQSGFETLLASRTRSPGSSRSLPPRRRPRRSDLRETVFRKVDATVCSIWRGELAEAGSGTSEELVNAVTDLAVSARRCEP